MMDQKKHILLGVTGGIAAYKSCELVRLLTKAGHKVTTVMTHSATQFIHPNTFQALSNQPVYTELWAEQLSNGMAHIQLTREADIFLIAPASTNTLAKLANGICDNLITNLALARTCPLAVAPAMNTQMWLSAPNQRNIEQLKKDGVTIFGPAQGELACGEVGAGRMLEAEELFELLPDLWTEKKLLDKKIMITAGSTYEAIDPVRGITNISSGKMGIALAKACRNAGAQVTLVLGKTSEKVPLNMNKTIHTESAESMFQAVKQEVTHCDIFISVAAVADYRIKNKSLQKIKKNHDKEVPILELEQNQDILSFVSHLPNPPFCVGFAAESEHLLENARKKKAKKGIPMLIANLVQTAMSSENNQVIILDQSDSETILPLMHKDDTAKVIINHLSQLI
ncbi:bifunctional phosphopantothenoylcysteine decarboxylase/phosphopantothenate--cysteine ligase CoaBC [Neisseria sp. Ec49-e6-T10]|uniref:bifunctional phosphopantothenoylcysteine decarboxylase/phosphopantothenate--cysteine ligase CoaBC n=1 Tax=Neisseria sp. Ec49-e6-T10 TaxID=3140744 RepID=UPI003EB7B99D